MFTLESLITTISSLLGPLAQPFQVLVLLIFNLIQTLTGQPTFCSSPAFCI